MDIWNELIAQPFTNENGVIWPEAYGDRICILEVEQDYQDKCERKSVFQSLKQSGHFESVEWDRTIGIQSFNEANTISSFADPLG